MQGYARWRALAVRSTSETVDICYYKSQPWGLAGDLLLGFVCDVDGETELSPQDGELASVEWVRREDIFEEDDHVSLTREMIIAFKNGKL